MSTALAERPVAAIDPAVVERVLIHGDLRQLTPAQKVSYYQAVCESVGLNPLTRPFEYIVLNGKETFYAKRDATDQLRKVHNISVQIISREVVEDCYVVTARATMPSGRQDESLGAVPIQNVKGEARANAMMKCETKAKRRVTLSICGLGMLDETEVQSITSDSPKAGYVVDAPAAPAAHPPAAPAVSAPPAPSGGDSGHPSAAYGEVNMHGEELPQDGQVYVAQVSVGPTKNPNVQRALITLSDARQFTTIKRPLIALCEQLCAERVPIMVGDDDYKQTKWGLDLIAIHRAEAPMPLAEPEPPLTDADIPFAWLLMLLVPTLGML